MSGGSWDYFYRDVAEISERLSDENCVYRKSLGNKMKLISEALKAVEWVDSGDWGQGDDIELIKKCFDDDKEFLSVLISNGSDIIKQLKVLGCGKG